MNSKCGQNEDYTYCPCTNFKLSVKGGCSYCQFGKKSAPEMQSMKLAKLSDREIRTINQYQTDFGNRYDRSIVLIAYTDKK
ncbi:MAG: hypothetical protein LBR56_02640 [Sporomusaceae bacterium]|jgi:hypothetical protein|nr:hypothetical protein [Sporomusaceae bacterium]